ncbi:hypothetical protein GCM10012288_05510 [Malaciobacter pacificus]|uniref:hypothetical protein n=1 Tax=Malaciobacter pacificus TaxID=1080223 RepID=UPI00102A277E|nr:hypothetical protein [Malaciobacter pacificus]GGD34442.1 hypothetical protein GCM10012288_05510 [Malaciobacter pacificus]
MKLIYLLLFSIIFSYANNLNPHKLSKDEITYLQYSPLNIYYNDWKPFTSYENGIIEGLSADIIKNLASNSNLKSHLQIIKNNP